MGLVKVRATVQLPGLPRGHEAMVDTDVKRIRQFLRAKFIRFVDVADEIAYLDELNPAPILRRFPEIPEISATADSVAGAVPPDPKPE